MMVDVRYQATVLLVVTEKAYMVPMRITRIDDPRSLFAVVVCV